MGCDMMLACGGGAAERQSLIGANYFDAGRQLLAVRSFAAAAHPLDDVIDASQIRLPQTRQTSALVGIQPVDTWGIQFGCNEHRVAVGTAVWRSRLPALDAGLSGMDLTRLALERGHSALHAVEVVTDLITRYGQRNAYASAPDSVFLLADPREAFVLEVAGRYWALSQCIHTRAVADVGLIRQDWKRLSPGLAEQAIQNGWWHDDGVKLDFGGVLGGVHDGHAWSLKRWSKGTLALAQREGKLDVDALRQMLADQFDSCVRQHALAPTASRRLASAVVRLDADATPLFWFAPGSMETPLYFPLVVGADAPVAYSGPTVWDESAASPALIKRLQRQFDQDVDEFLGEAQQLHKQGEASALLRLAQAMMLRHIEQWEAGEQRRFNPAKAASRPVRDDEELASYSFG